MRSTDQAFVAWISSDYFKSLLLPQLLRGENDLKQSDEFQAKVFDAFLINNSVHLLIKNYVHNLRSRSPQLLCFVTKSCNKIRKQANIYSRRLKLSFSWNEANSLRKMVEVLPSSRSSISVKQRRSSARRVTLTCNATITWSERNWP